MRNSIRVLAIAGALAVPVAVGASATAAKKPTVCKPVPKNGVAYVVRGTLVSDATRGQLVIDVTGGNKHGKKALPALGSYDVGLPIAIWTCSKVSRITAGGRERKQARTALKAGDRVLISWKAKKGKTLANLGAAQRVVELR